MAKDEMTATEIDSPTNFTVEAMHLFTVDATAVAASR